MLALIKVIKNRCRDEARKRQLIENAQLCFVAVIWLVVLTLMLTLSACAPKAGDKPPVASPVPKQEALKVRVAGAADPNSYLARLEWNHDTVPQHWLIHRKNHDKAGETVQIAVLDGKERSAVDGTVQPGARYTYILAAVTDPHYAIKGKAEVSVPRDKELVGSFAAPDFTGISRVFLRRDAKLLVGAAPLKIEVDEIFSDGASIETFPSGQAALPGVNGRSAGDITIRARRASGTLAITTNGERGGDGIYGSPGQRGATGTPGTPGRWDMNPEAYRVFNKSYVDSWKLAMERDPKPPGHPEWQHKVGNWSWYVCATEPTDGGRGGNGTTGGDGGLGGNGGDSAKVHVEIAEDSDFKVDAVGQPGGWGLPGRGGLGGPGGSGGPPGPRDQGHLCREPQPGPKGSDGLAGRPGRYGEAGKRKGVCVRIGPRASSDCK